MPSSLAAIGEAQAIREESKTAQAISKINEQQLRVKAEQETLIAQEEQKRLGEEKKRELSRLRVLAGNAGIDIVGTPLLQSAEVAGEFEAERQFIGQAGRQQRFELESEATIEKARRASKRKISRFRVGSTLLTGAASDAALFSGGGGGVTRSQFKRALA